MSGLYSSRDFMNALAWYKAPGFDFKIPELNIPDLKDIIPFLKQVLPNEEVTNPVLERSKSDLIQQMRDWEKQIINLGNTTPALRELMPGWDQLPEDFKDAVLKQLSQKETTKEEIAKAALVALYLLSKDENIQDMKACAEWTWGVLQGDFNDNPSMSQIAAGTLISMIPVADQLCDIRDIIANTEKLHEKPDDHGHWIGLVLTLIGLFPVLGSLVKGALKALFLAIKRAGGKMTKEVWDACMTLLNRFLDMPAARRYITENRIADVYTEIANGIEKRILKARFDVIYLKELLIEKITETKDLLNFIRQWLSDSIKKSIDVLLDKLKWLEDASLKMLEAARRRVEIILKQIINLLRNSTHNNYRAFIMDNPHIFNVNPRRILAADEAELLKRERPDWVKIRSVTDELLYPPLEEIPLKVQKDIKRGWPDVGTENGPLEDAYRTFHSMEKDTLSGGTVIYRIVDPTSGDNSICWLLEADFKALKSKSEWRQKSAVWKSWNENGEFVTYVVPPEGLKVWKGPAASQVHKNADELVLEGGAVQVVVDPKQLLSANIGKREPTPWGDAVDRYGDGFPNDPTPFKLGLPALDLFQLKNKIYE